MLNVLMGEPRGMGMRISLAAVTLFEDLTTFLVVSTNLFLVLFKLLSLQPEIDPGSDLLYRVLDENDEASSDKYALIEDMRTFEHWLFAEP
jgi:hypothetical protein